MKKQRLLKLAALLRKDADNKKGVTFNMSYWAAPTERVSNHFIQGAYDEPPETIPVSCGTSACAMGLAVISGAFKRAGLYADFYQRSEGVAMEPCIDAANGERRGGYYAAMELFGISMNYAEYLFNPSAYPEAYRKGAKAERYVAKRIEQFVERGGPPQGSRFYYNHL